jgi:carbonic anhydrase
MGFSHTVLVLLVCLYFRLCQSADWNYHNLGPEVWPDLFPACAGSSQSPIDIKTACTVHQPFPAFNLSSNYGMDQAFSASNNGHGISAVMVSETNLPLSLIGGGLNGTYSFVNFHMHWGENYGAGSEHQM